MTEDWVQVSKETFFATVGKLDVHPRCGRDRSVWEMRHSREVVGISTPGYIAEGERSYSVTAAFAKANGLA